MRTESLPELAICGGRPAFAEPLHVGAPNICDRGRLFARIGEVLERGRLTNRGPCVREFEAAVAELTGVKHCIAMCNGTTALEIGARALGLRGEVLVPAFTFVATPHALSWQDITPVFCDVDPRTHLIDPRDAERRITERTTGIVPVHLWGRPAPVVELSRLASRHGLKLMYDAAHAFGCSHRGRMIGGFGDLEVFSFHATKVLGTAEGGAVVTNDDDLAARVRLMQNFGFTGLDRVDALGVNGKMSELSAAMGLTALEELAGWTAINRAHALLYRDSLADLPGLTVLADETADRRNHQYVVVEIDEERVGLSRDRVMKVLREENVLARRYFYPGCHRMEPYRAAPPAAGWHLPVTEALSARVLVLPTGAQLAPADVRRVADLLRTIFGSAAALNSRLDRCDQGEIS